MARRAFIVVLFCALAVSALSMPAGDAVAPEGDPITDVEKPVLAATRIFASENHLHSDIAAANADEGHIGERFEVNHAPGEKCTFTMRRRDGPIIESISFDRLSNEYSTSRQDGYTLLVIPGKPGAQCEYNGRAKKCSNTLEMLLMDDELTLAVRALKYLFSNVCDATQLPF
jgi:hypothetical protein